VRVDFGVSARFIALWLLLAGCSSEEASNVPNEEETTSTASLP
jgi:PBP1b-binding outer membrane lipoprotein LpoB